MTALRFVLIGGAATLLHLLIVALAIGGGAPPLWSNGLAFAIAFAFSFFGHFHVSFRGHGRKPASAFGRFACTALLGFGTNQSLLAALILLGAWPGLPAAILSTGAAALLTYLLSRGWAFR